MEKCISITEAGLLLGVTTKTLRRWEAANKLIPSHRTLGNHRRYKLSELLNIIQPTENQEDKQIVCYARVSTHDQKNDLKTQLDVLEQHAKQNNFENAIYLSDIGSGLNFKKKGLNKLIQLILSKQIDKIILTHKDRLLRFGSDLIINIAKHFGIETVILNSKTQTFEEELASDVLEIITVFSAKLYGSRSHKNKKLIKKGEIVL